MNVKIKMPDIGNSEADIEIKKWLVAPGDPIQRGQVLLEVEADKGVAEVESFLNGVLTEQCVNVGDVTETGQIIAVVTVDDTQ